MNKGIIKIYKFANIQVSEIGEGRTSTGYIYVQTARDNDRE